MVCNCCVPGCGLWDQKKPLHSIPKDLERAQEWCRRIQRLDLLDKDLKAIRNNYRICDRHFDEWAKFECYKNRTNLKANSLPTLQLPGTERDDIVGTSQPSIVPMECDNEKSENREQELLVLDPGKMHYCDVPGCTKTSENSENSFFRFPLDVMRCNKWKSAVNSAKINPLTAAKCYERMRICSDHFQVKDFSSLQKNRLNRIAVPTVLPSATSPSTELNSKSAAAPNVTIVTLASIERSNHEECNGSLNSPTRQPSYKERSTQARSRGVQTEPEVDVETITARNQTLQAKVKRLERKVTALEEDIKRRSRFADRYTRNDNTPVIILKGTLRNK